VFRLALEKAEDVSVFVQFNETWQGSGSEEETRPKIGSTLTTAADHAGFETFRMVAFLDGQTWALQTIHGTYVSVTDCGSVVTRERPSASESFKLVFVEAGGYALQSFFNTYLSMPDERDRNVRTSNAVQGAWEVFEFFGF